MFKFLIQFFILKIISSLYYTKLLHKYINIVEFMSLSKYWTASCVPEFQALTNPTLELGLHSNSLSTYAFYMEAIKPDWLLMMMKENCNLQALINLFDWASYGFMLILTLAWIGQIFVYLLCEISHPLVTLI